MMMMMMVTMIFAQGFFGCEEEMVSTSFLLKINTILASCVQRRVGGLDIGHVQRIKRVMQHSRSPMHFQCATSKNFHTIKCVAVMSMMFAQESAPGWTSRLVGAFQDWMQPAWDARALASVWSLLQSIGTRHMSFICHN